MGLIFFNLQFLRAGKYESGGAQLDHADKAANP